MRTFLRFLGTLNLAVWVGAAVFLTLVAGRVFFSEEMLALLPRFHAGKAAQLLLGGYFRLQLVCAFLALVQLLAGWFYAGRAPSRGQSGLLALLLALTLLGGYGVQPRLRELHTQMYDPAQPTEARDAARQRFRRWHAVSQSGNLLLTLGVIGYFWLHLHGPQRSHRLGRSQL